MTTPDEARRLASELAKWARDYATTDYTDEMASNSAVTLLALASQVEQQAARIAELQAQVQRVPLTVEQIDKLRIRMANRTQDMINRGLLCGEDIMDELFVREVEQAHGITEASHG